MRAFPRELFNIPLDTGRVTTARGLVIREKARWSLSAAQISESLKKRNASRGLQQATTSD